MTGLLEFSEEGHGYFYDGMKVPSVSKILEFIYPDPNKRFYKPEHAIRGQYVHTITEYIDDDNLDWGTLDEELKPYAKAYCQFLEDEKPEWEYTERMVFNQSLFYAGRLDRSGIIKGKYGVLDVKTGSGGRNIKYGLQTAAYDMALTSTDEKRNARWVLHLRKTGKYKLEEYTEQEDYMTFKCGAWLYNWNKKNGLLKV